MSGSNSGPSASGPSASVYIGGRKRKHSSVEVVAQKKISKTASEAKDITREMAITSLQKLVSGYTPPLQGVLGYQPTARGWGPALGNSCGCQLAQKSPNHPHGYIQITVDRPKRARSANGTTVEDWAQQSAHRLVVLAYKSQNEIDLLLDNSYHASHLCGNPNCISPSHICVESRSTNEPGKPVNKTYFSPKL
ncbi:uncharacterized protein BP5553_04387 [Venustampulla echinocandica]|uniref:Zinc-binding loop region of homing endonuclease domain-containing protein n=1 Tax=Venustampulla echinocandica TaxID=2656787 RepID=A0A370TN60_9HELO|nr:uncharacterized protein BP5553_04387 [Venustampulla echinocandica]RDL36954.1 hypothetical protein BP5553_04387 [Venustampulla echinocandica]